MNESVRSTDQLSTSFSIETLEEIVRNCQRNERRLHELERHIRHERKKAERLLRETYRECEKQISISLNNSSIPKPQQFFVSLDDDNQDYHRHNNKDKPSKEQAKKSTSSIHSITDNTNRVRFNVSEKDNQRKTSSNKDDELDDLERRCEQLISRLNTQRLEASLLEHDHDNYPQQDQSISLQQYLELLRPQFISDSHQRVQRINHLREERENKPEIDRSRSHSNLLPVSFSYKEMKQAAKKKYQQLPEYHDRLRQGLISEIQRRNYLRANIFRIRLRQHVLSHGRTNIDKSLTMIDS